MEKEKGFVTLWKSLSEHELSFGRRISRCAEFRLGRNPMLQFSVQQETHPLTSCKISTEPALQIGPILKFPLGIGSAKNMCGKFLLSPNPFMVW